MVRRYTSGITDYLSKQYPPKIPYSYLQFSLHEYEGGPEVTFPWYYRRVQEFSWDPITISFGTVPMPPRSDAWRVGAVCVRGVTDDKDGEPLLWVKLHQYPMYLQEGDELTFKGHLAKELALDDCSYTSQQDKDASVTSKDKESRRLMKVLVTPEVLMDIFTTDRVHPAQTIVGIPTTAQRRGISYEILTDEFVILFWDASFEIVPEGGIPPTLSIQIRKYPLYELEKERIRRVEDDWK